MKMSQFAQKDAPKAQAIVRAADWVWSGQQEDVFEWFVDGEGHLIVRARAGTSKTTTAIEGVNRAPETNILVCAFNKRIADELNTRIANRRATAKTLHALGYAAIRNQWAGLGVAKGTDRADLLTRAVVAKDTPKPIISLISKLHTKVREIDPLLRETTIQDLAYKFDCEPDVNWGRYDLDFVVDAATSVMKTVAKAPPRSDVGIDFADMIALPLLWNLLTPNYDLVVVDEAQDMTLAQLEIAQRSCSGRICVIGDDRQACYGFRGADSNSLERLKTQLGAGELPLTETYRCATLIVARANKLVPDLRAVQGAPLGVVDECHYSQIREQAKPGDFILSRLNAPNVSLTLALLREGIRARMVGRDIGAGIKAILRKMKLQPYDNVDLLLARLDEWRRKTTTKYAQVGQLDLVARTNDQADTLMALTEEASTVGDVENRCLSLFGDDLDPNDMVILSSIHRAKGLEATRVFVLSETLYRRGIDREEENLDYIATTRAKTHLTLVTGVPAYNR